MSISRRNLLAAAGALAAPAVFAQSGDFPNRAIEIIVPATAGGPADRSARLIAGMLREAVGQPVIVDNRVGAGGIIASNYVARAEKTGYVIGMISDSTVVNPLTSPDVHYTLEDFQVLAPMYMGSMALAVGKDFPARNVAEFIAYVKKTGKVSLGMYGVVSSPRIAAEIFLDAAKIDMEPIPYKGETEAVRDVMAGVTPAYFGTTPPLIEQHKGGTLRVLAITAPDRLAVLPDVPTFKEEGLTGVVYRWFHGLTVPAGTPQPVVDRLVKELKPIIASDRFKAGIGPDLVTVSMSPKEFANQLTTLRARIIQVMHDRKITA